MPYNPDSDQIRVERWLKKKGGTALRGEPIVERLSCCGRRVIGKPDSPLTPQ
ncbi:MAG TPA: hypothetical protein VER06_00090 [Candidatus Methanoperedens sp.]|nr:hypothetical protein [Candidatus Methanoperedens sp.]